MYDKLIFELSKEGRVGYIVDDFEVDVDACIPSEYLRKTELDLPSVSENEVVRHYTSLSNKNYSVESGFYPLGSCTMKYNPKLNEDVSRIGSFANIHPYQPEHTVQGSLELMYNFQNLMCEISGMDEFTLMPSAGAHGELTGILIMKAYHESRNDTKRTKIIVPDSAHGTNPATANMGGYKVVQVPSTKDGCVDMEAFKAVLGDDIAGLMLTNPSTLGLFEKNIEEIASLVHGCGGLLYYDGANLNAIMGKTRPGDMGFDIMHSNLHKTFSTPHGGGGPGSGPVGVKSFLAKHLPKPTVCKDEDRYYLNYDIEDSIGSVKAYYGNFGVFIKAYTYILTMGNEGLKRASEVAVLNANYVQEKLKNHYNLAVDTLCKHEFVLSGIKDNKEITTLDIAKRLIDYGVHPPTIYFPLIVNNAMMIEPTESESKEVLDNFIDIMIKISKESFESPELLKEAPHNTAVRRIDEILAAKKPILKYQNI